MNFSKKAFIFPMRFHHILIYALLSSAAITAMLAHWVDAIVILAVVLANAIVEAEKQIRRSLSTMGS